MIDTGIRPNAFSDTDQDQWAYERGQPKLTPLVWNDCYSAATSSGTPGPKVVESVPFWM
jgi:hypothetical protein